MSARRRGTVLIAAVVIAAGACARERPRPPTVVAEPMAGACPAGTSARGAAPPAGDRTWCELPDGREHGPFATFFPSGKRRSAGTYRLGALDGAWTSFYEDGTVRARGRYVRGAVVGTWSEYFADGELALELVHEGELRHHRSFHPGGKRHKEGDFLAGREHGRWREWDQTGKLVSEVVYDMGVVRGTPTPTAWIGIVECDRYIDAYMRCIDTRVPEAARSQMREAITQTVDAWRQAAAGPAKDGLATACLAAYDAAKQATASMGCEW